MSRQRSEAHARRYVAWIDRHVSALVGAHLLVLAASIYLIVYHLPLLTDLASLLPQDAPAVRDMRRLEDRLPSNDTVLVVVQAPDPDHCAAASRAMAAALHAIPHDLVTRIDEDDPDARAFVRAHRHLLVPLADLTRARDALRHRIEQAKLEADPLYVNLDEPDAAATAATKRELDDLRTKRRDAERALDRPSNVSADGKSILLVVRTPVAAIDVANGRRLLDALDAARAPVIAAHPGVQIGFAGDLVTAISEHRAIVDGTMRSSVVTAVLVGLVLWLYFGSFTLLILLVVTLGIATTVAFGAAALTVGHLNAATAFLGAIIAGNGVNYGILLFARFLEERRRAGVEDALAVAIAGTLRPTLVASLAASTAYGSLAATSFKGFADFALIGGVGMVLCWIASYALLPALVLRFARRPSSRRGDILLGRALVRVVGTRRSSIVVAVAGVMMIGAAGVVVRYIVADPFEYDMSRLGSDDPDAVEERHWMQTSDRTFGRGVAGRTFIAADRSDQVPLIVAALRARDAGIPPAEQTIGSIDSILDVVPADQPARLAVLHDIRTLLDDDALDALDDDERKELDELRPPADVPRIEIGQLPAGIKERLKEKDGRIGLVISIRPAEHLDELDGHALIRFANAVSRVDLPNRETVTTSGASVIFANILASIARDGPRVTLLAGAALVVLVVILVGYNRRSAVVIIATCTGSLFMVATCALWGLRVNFLDFVALPITLGLGVDYAINIAHRHEQDVVPDPISTLGTSGSAVFVCSLTTMIGYGSLLASANLAIRGFGAASLIGEVTSVLAALVLVPALLVLAERKRDVVA
jgi:predicted RND superfamily exporter protein